MTPSETIRAVVRYAIMGVAVIVTAFVIAFALQQSQVDEIQRLADQNRRLIEEVDRLNRTQADTAYKECLDRNARARLSLDPRRGLPAWARAERADGNRNTAKFLEQYVEQLTKAKLPVCEKPKRQ